MSARDIIGSLAVKIGWEVTLDGTLAVELVMAIADHSQQNHRLLQNQNRIQMTHAIRQETL
ncbi:hypothetical protein B0D95_07045 [Cellvibrio sp. PSBB023]|nr:hypothetical protein B0D95_07045 [Cellvibrio sp. PSBB023]